VSRPEVTIVFWIIKILATTLGETGGDAVSMSMGLGYLISTGIFLFKISSYYLLGNNNCYYHTWYNDC